MDWDLFKFWLNELSNVLLGKTSISELKTVYNSMSGYYQKHKKNEIIKNLKKELLK